MTLILGLSFGFHDSAAAIVADGRTIAAAQEERFTRRRHDCSLPEHAIEYCLGEAGVQHAELDYIGLYEKPLTKFDRILRTQLQAAPLGFTSFRSAMPKWIAGADGNHAKLFTRRRLQRLFPDYKRQFIFVDHHQAHAAGAFFTSPFKHASVLTVDGVGQWQTTGIGIGNGNRIVPMASLRFPHSLGLLYSAFTHHCGFKVDSGEYKLMGLAPYGTPRFVDVILDNVIDVRADGSFRLNMRFFNFVHGVTMTNRRFEKLFGMPRRIPESQIRDHDRDMAASVQKVTEMILMRIAAHTHTRTRQSNLCIAGGVGLNAVAVGRLMREGPFENIHVQPAAGDAGGALGTSKFIAHQLLGQSRPAERDPVFLGPEYSDREIDENLQPFDPVAEAIEDADDLIRRVAELLASQKVVGWMQSRMEFGPRALGHRSILADPRDANMQKKLNLKIKFRESFRPFAPIVLQDQASRIFDVEPNINFPSMTAVVQVRPEYRDHYPAITHVDGTARIQTVGADQGNDRTVQLLSEFHRITGCPVLVNTSFNVRGEPIVCTPADAWQCFTATDMDAVVIGNRLFLKSRQL